MGTVQIEGGRAEDSVGSKEQLMEFVSVCDEERRKYLTEFFEYIPDMVVEKFQYIEVKKGQGIIIEGQPCENVYIVLEGDIKGIDYSQKGSAYSFMDFSRMYILGDFEGFSLTPEYIATLYAAQDCRLLKVSAASYHTWVKQDHNALFLRLNNVLGILTNERRMDRNFLHLGCKGRVMNYLARYYEKNETSASQVRVALTQVELAEKVGANVRSVQRAVASLEAEGLVSIVNRKMMVSYEQYLKLVEEEKNERREENGKI